MLSYGVNASFFSVLENGRVFCKELIAYAEFLIRSTGKQKLDGNAALQPGADFSIVKLCGFAIPSGLLQTKHSNNSIFQQLLHVAVSRTINIIVSRGTIWTYNCYSQPPGDPRNIAFSTPVHYLNKLLAEEGHYLVVGDFNLHHPLWCRVRNPATHDLSETLIDQLESKGLELLTP